ncbi:acetate--CoA ligase family protein [Advenella alkanexedens]|uniref:acetate--CoA ligase family protein n=1 Tax=Advenella alkanexedens TaxID=1481665 RepID=UPI002674BA3F|nr:acetate--CoA ligase family protein [Advenella alkanexedens]WKU20051.1 acetate--CoA ligase family protein [Advenella alkanexedens]
MDTLVKQLPGAGMDVFFSAKGIAIIGASDDVTKIGGRPIQFLLKYGYKGRVYPVNPRGGVIQGLPAYTSISELPGQADMAVLAVPAPATIQALKDCAEGGVRAVVVLSSGFAEAGEEGVLLQAELVAIARKYGIRLLGPNCLGTISVEQGVIASFSIILEQSMPPAGHVGIVSQSGNVGSYAVQNIARRGLGLSHFIATGNEADIDVADGIAALANDPQTHLVLCCMETCRDADRLIYALDLARKNNKPVVVLKIGSTEQGQAAAASHTGALASSDAVIDAVFRRYGVLRVHSIEALLDIGHAASLLLPGKLPEGDRITVLAASGGFGIMMADATVKAGLTLATLTDQTKDKIRAVLPLAGTNNPVDATAQVSSRPDVLYSMLSALMEDHSSDVTQVFLSLSLYNARLRSVYMEALQKIRANYPDRLLVITSQGPADAVKEINDMGIPVFPSIDATAQGLAGLVQMSRLATVNEGERYQGVVESLDRQVFRNEYTAKKALATAGIPMLDEVVVSSADQAAQEATRMGFPVVLKIVSEDIQHKTEIGGVKLNVPDEAGVRAAYRQIMQSVTVHAPNARLDGILVTPMVKGGAELIMGIFKDPVFGPVVMVGTGGIYAEVLQDVALQAAPVSETEAQDMIRSLKLFAILDGARGQPKADIKAAATTLAKLSQFACRYADDVAEIDMNPVLVRPEGQGAIVLDALLIPTTNVV